MGYEKKKKDKREITKKVERDVDRILEENNLATLDPCSRID